MGGGQLATSGIAPDLERVRTCWISAAGRGSPLLNWRSGSGPKAGCWLSTSRRASSPLWSAKRAVSGSGSSRHGWRRPSNFNWSPPHWTAPLRAGSSAFCRDPAPVIHRVVAGLRPGGRLVIWDYLNYRATTLQPRSPVFDRVLAAVKESWKATGGDLDVGARLPGLVVKSGCRLVDLVPLVEGSSDPARRFWDWPTQFFFGYVPRLVEAGLLTEADRCAFEAEWRARERDPGTFLSSPPMIGIIAEKT